MSCCDRFVYIIRDKASSYLPLVFPFFNYRVEKQNSAIKLWNNSVVRHKRIESIHQAWKKLLGTQKLDKVPQPVTRDQVHSASFAGKSTLGGASWEWCSINGYIAADGKVDDDDGALEVRPVSPRETNRIPLSMSRPEGPQMLFSQSGTRCRNTMDYFFPPPIPLRAVLAKWNR